MKIAAIKICTLDLPYKRPLITATNRFSKAEGLLLEAISEEGTKGFGYVDLFPRTGETLGSAQYAIEAIIKPVVEGRDLRELAKIREDVNRVFIGNPRTKSGVETALYDLLARSLKVPLYVLLGGQVRKEVRVIRMVGLDAPEAMAAEARALIEKGFVALKLKISGDLSLDVQRISKVRQAVGEAVFIKVDANESYDTKSAIQLAKRFANLSVQILEQPVPRAQIEALMEVKRNSPIKIEADQSVASLSDAYRLIKDGVVDSINTSVQKAGGLFEARQIAELCALGGVNCTLSNTAGSMVGDAAALHLAVSSSGISSLCELGEFETIEGDPFSGLKVEGSVLKVPEGYGLGVAN